MCVIAICETVRPSNEMLEKMWSQNSDGAGIAWRDGDKVRWRKGLAKSKMLELCNELPLPYVAHFRIASVGGIVPGLTHPFTVDEFDKSMDLEGETGGYLLFHNGHWNDWKNTMIQTAVQFKHKVPEGRWSDTRAMAWMARDDHYGIGFLDVLNEKTVIFGPDRLVVSAGTGWKKIDEVWCSNDFFSNARINRGSTQAVGTTDGAGHTNSQTWKICQSGKCTEVDNLVNGFCPKHSGGGLKALPPTKPVIERLREAEAEEKAYKEGTIKVTDRKYSKNELKRLRKQASGYVAPSSSTT